MKYESLTIERFAQVLAAYGGETAHWPEEERAAAERLLLQSTEARRMLEEEREFDALLAQMPAPAPASESLYASIADIAVPKAAAPKVVQEPVSAWRRGWARFGGWRPAGAALAASLMLGVVFGGMVGPASAKPEQVDLVELALLNNTFSGY